MTCRTTLSGAPRAGRDRDTALRHGRPGGRGPRDSRQNGAPSALRSAPRHRRDSGGAAAKPTAAPTICATRSWPTDSPASPTTGAGATRAAAPAGRWPSPATSPTRS